MSSRECPCAAVRCSGSLPWKPARRSCSKPSARSRGACSCSMKPHAMHGPRQHTRAMWRPSQGCPLGRCKARLPEVSAGLARGAARPSHPPMRLSLRQFPAVGVDLPWSIPPPFPLSPVQREARHAALLDVDATGTPRPRPMPTSTPCRRPRRQNCQHRHRRRRRHHRHQSRRRRRRATIVAAVLTTTALSPSPPTTTMRDGANADPDPDAVAAATCAAPPPSSYLLSPSSSSAALSSPPPHLKPPTPPPMPTPMPPPMTSGTGVDAVGYIASR